MRAVRLQRVRASAIKLTAAIIPNERADTMCKISDCKAAGWSTRSEPQRGDANRATEYATECVLGDEDGQAMALTRSAVV
jgi:hypothetical protein